MRSKYPLLTFGFPPERQKGRYFGGDDPPPQQSTTTVAQQYSPEEAAKRAKVMDEAARIYQSQQGAVQNLSPTGPSADTLKAQSFYRNLAGGGAQPLIESMQKATQFGLTDAMNPGSNPALKQTLDTATRQVGEAYTGPGGVLSRIRSQFQGGNTGGVNSTREGIALGNANQSYLNTIGDVTGKITSDAYGKGLDTFSRTMALAPQTLGMMAQPGQWLGAIGAQNEAYEDANRQWQLQAPWAAFTPYAQTVAQMGNPSSVTTATAPGAQKNPMAPFGAAMMGASLGSSLFPAVAGATPYGAMAGAGAMLAMSLFD